MDFRYVRMREYKPRIGQSAKSRTIIGSDRDYRIAIDPQTLQRPWNKVPLAIAAICEEMTVDPNRDGSPLCMEVCTEEEARELDAMAERARLAQKAREAPTVDDAISHVGSGDLSLEEVHSRRTKALVNATAPAGPPIEEIKAGALEEAKAGLADEFRAALEDVKAEVSEIKQSADDAAKASEAVINAQAGEIEELRKELKSAKAAAKEKPPKKPRGRPPKKKN